MIVVCWFVVCLVLCGVCRDWFVCVCVFGVVVVLGFADVECVGCVVG